MLYIDTSHITIDSVWLAFKKRSHAWMVRMILGAFVSWAPITIWMNFQFSIIIIIDSIEFQIFIFFCSIVQIGAIHVPWAKLWVLWALWPFMFLRYRAIKCETIFSTGWFYWKYPFLPAILPPPPIQLYPMAIAKSWRQVKTLNENILPVVFVRHPNPSFGSTSIILNCKWT